VRRTVVRGRIAVESKSNIVVVTVAESLSNRDSWHLSTLNIWSKTVHNFLSYIALIHTQWCRYVVIYGGSGSVRSIHRTVSGASKSFTFHFWHIQVFHPWWCETCRVIQQQPWMKECDSFRGESKHTLTPPIYFQGSRPPNPRVYTAAHTNGRANGNDRVNFPVITVKRGGWSNKL